MVLNVVFEHASVPAGGPQALRLLVDDVRQKFNPRPLAVDPGATSRKVDAGSLRLLNTFMKTKLGRAGVSDAGHTGKWRLVWVVEEFFVVANRLEMIATIDLTITVTSLETDVDIWQGKLQDRWPVEGYPSTILSLID